jgi:hypothetical protein
MTEILKLYQKLLAALGNIRAMEALHIDNYTENKIQNLKGEVYGASVDGKILFYFNNIAGYIFLEVVVLSSQNIKSMKGADLILSGAKSLSINSDTTEIESDFSNISNQWMTKISFIVSEEEKEIIQSKQYSIIDIDYYNYKLKFNLYV